MNYAPISIEEQETVIVIPRKGNVTISTTDRTMMTKLDRLVNESEAYTLDKVYTMQGRIDEKRYILTEKSFISFRKKIRHVAGSAGNTEALIAYRTQKAMEA